MTEIIMAVSRDIIIGATWDVISVFNCQSYCFFTTLRNHFSFLPYYYKLYKKEDGYFSFNQKDSFFVYKKYQY